MQNKFNLLLCFCLVTLLLPACGGSGNQQATSTAVVLQGVAATGGPLNGTLSVSDCSFPNRSTSAAINQDGTFSVSTAGMSPPYFLRAAGTDSSGTAMTLYSFATSPGTVNINPLTSLLVAAAGGAADATALSGLYANHNISSGLTLAAALPGATSALLTALEPLTSLYGITALDPFTYSYQMNHQGLDGLFDDVDISFASGTLVFTDKSLSANFYSAPLSSPGSGALQSTLLPVPTQYAMPGNARLTLMLGGLPSSGTVVRHLKTTIQLPLGVTVNTDSTGTASVVNTAIPSGNGTGAIVYPSPALSATNNQVTIELTSLNGFGAGEFLTLRCLVSYDQLSLVKAADFSVVQTQIYGDIYKLQKFKGGTVTLTNLVFPVTEGGNTYTSLCAGCHTLSSVDTVGTPSLLNKADLLPATFATVHHGISLTQLQIEDLQAFLEAQ